MKEAGEGRVYSRGGKFFWEFLVGVCRPILQIRLGRKHKNYSNLFGIRIFLFLSYSFGIVYPFSDQNSAKTLPDGAAHTYMAYTREYPPGST